MNHVFVYQVLASSFFVSTITLAQSTLDQSLDQSMVMAVSTTDADMNIASIEFYRSVYLKLRDQGSWSIAPQEITAKNVANPVQNLESIPTVSRHEVLSAMQRSEAKSPNLPIKTLQKALETMAISGAVIADCTPSDAHSVSSCQLLFYERSKARIVARANKKFHAPIDDPSRWGDRLLAHLVSTMKAKRRATDEAVLKRMMEDETLSRPSSRLIGLVRAQGVGQKLPGVGSRQLPEVRVGFGVDRPGLNGGIEIGYSSLREASEAEPTRFSQRRLGGFLASYARALETLIWKLETSLGVAERHLHLPDGHIQSRSLYLGFGPALAWSIGDDWEVGIKPEYQRWFSLSQDDQGSLKGHRLPNSSMAMSIAVQRSIGD